MLSSSQVAGAATFLNWDVEPYKARFASVKTAEEDTHFADRTATKLEPAGKRCKTAGTELGRHATAAKCKAAAVTKLRE